MSTRADVVAFLDFDRELLAPRYRAAEQAMALLTKAARLLGPRRRGGRLMIQTFMPHHEVIQAALLADPARLLDAGAAAARAARAAAGDGARPVSGPGSDEVADAAAGGARSDGRRWPPATTSSRAPTWDQLGDALIAADRPKGSRVARRRRPAAGLAAEPASSR